MTESPRPTGIVYLVGAGPGHPGLITRWGYELLQHCDAVAYDALIPMELIAGLPQTVEKHYVGKRAGRHSFPQSQINELLVTLARRGLKVVRLKGGDPFIYGRSGEEAEYLSAAGIPAVIIPGVTAASAAAALSGFSLTNRHSSSWVFLATGHAAEKSTTPVPWERVGALPGGTIVIYMGLAKLDHVIHELLSSGIDPQIPAVAVQAASTGLQRVVEAPLTDISSECRRQKLKPPALVIIGGAVGNRIPKIAEQTKSLPGRTVLVTSPSRSTGRLCARLREAGAEPIPYPTVLHTPAHEVENWDQFLKLIDREAFCFFLGETAVDCFVDELLSRGLDLRSLGSFKLIASGPSTQSALFARGLKADRTLQRPDPELLAECISELVPDSLLPLVIVDGGRDRDPLEARLQKQCASVTSISVYVESTAEWDVHWKDGLTGNPPDFVLFTGKAEVDGFVELLGDDSARQLALKSCIVSTGEAVLEALSRYGLSAKLKANISDIDSLIEALARFRQTS